MVMGRPSREGEVHASSWLKGSSPVNDQYRRVDERVGTLTRYVASELDDMSDDYVFREAIAKAAVRDFCHELVRAFPDHQDTIAQALREMVKEVPSLSFEDVND